MKKNVELSNEEQNAAFMLEIPKIYSDLGLELLTQICGTDKRPRARMLLKLYVRNRTILLNIKFSDASVNNRKQSTLTKEKRIKVVKNL